MRLRWKLLWMAAPLVAFVAAAEAWRAFVWREPFGPLPLLVIHGAAEPGEPVGVSQEAIGGRYLGRLEFSRSRWQEESYGPAWSATCVDVLDSRHLVIASAFGLERVELSPAPWGLDFRTPELGADSSPRILERLRRIAVGRDFHELDALGFTGDWAPARCPHGTRIANLRWPDGQSLVDTFNAVTRENWQSQAVPGLVAERPSRLAAAELQELGDEMLAAAALALSWEVKPPVHFTLMEKDEVRARFESNNSEFVQSCPLAEGEVLRAWDESTWAQVSDGHEVWVVDCDVHREMLAFLLAHEVAHIYQFQMLGFEPGMRLPTNVVEAHASAVALQVLGPGFDHRAMDTLLCLGDYTNWWREFDRLCSATALTPDQLLQWLMADPGRVKDFDSVTAGLRPPARFLVTWFGATVLDGLMFTVMEPRTEGHSLVEIRNTRAVPFTGLFTGEWRGKGGSQVSSGSPPFRLHLPPEGVAIVEVRGNWKPGLPIFGAFAAAVDPLESWPLH